MIIKNKLFWFMLLEELRMVRLRLLDFLDNNIVVFLFVFLMFIDKEIVICTT